MSQLNLNYSELHRRLVLDRQTSEKVGHLSQLLLDPPSQKIVGFDCGGGLLGGPRQTFSWTQVESIGSDSILISGKPWNPNVEGSGPINAPIGHELWTNGGDHVGKIVDILFNPETGNVTHYLFTSKGWQGVIEGTYLLPSVAVSSIGSKRILALESMLSNPQKYTEGLGQKVGQMAEFLKADYEKTKQDLASITQGARQVMEQVKEALPEPPNHDNKSIAQHSPEKEESS
jgi:uncharacterized protein YrrD